MLNWKAFEKDIKFNQCMYINGLFRAILHITNTRVMLYITNLSTGGFKIHHLFFSPLAV